jgi:hypothetical protein
MKKNMGFFFVRGLLEQEENQVPHAGGGLGGAEVYSHDFYPI